MQDLFEYDVIIPTFGRPDHLCDTLNSVAGQIIRPAKVIVVDNNTDPVLREKIQKYIQNFASVLNVVYLINMFNSGAVARNLGVSISLSPLVAFLDDDVVLMPTYYYELLLLFKDPYVVGAQGVDTSLISEYHRRKNSHFLNIAGIYLENFFETSTVFGKRTARVMPSLAVEHPDLSQEFTIDSEWTSTCAGMFRRDIFQSVQFPSIFVKYSWNEYLFFSNMIWKLKLGRQIYTSKAKYSNIQTNDGRLPSVELIYMAEIYDFYVFSNLFDLNIFSLSYYLKSRIGRFLYAAARVIFFRPRAFLNFFSFIKACLLVICNNRDISSGDLSCYNKRFDNFG